MTDSKPILRLDLEPKLNRPLQLWNPLDYLRLLYWIFYFPQALIWYKRKFCHTNFNYMPTNRILLKLNSQIIITLLFILFFVYMILFVDYFSSIYIKINEIQKQIHLFNPVILNVVFLFTYTLYFMFLYWLFNKLLYAPEVGFTSKMIILINSGSGLIFLISYINTSSINIYHLFFIAFFITTMVVHKFNSNKNKYYSASPYFLIKVKIIEDKKNPIYDDLNHNDISHFKRMNFNLKLGRLIGRIILLLALLTVFTFMFFIAGNYGIIVLLVGLRFEEWIISLFLFIDKKNQYIPHTTEIPIPRLSAKLINSLRQDWYIGLMNLEQIATYTLQFTTLERTIRIFLDCKDPDEIIEAVSQLSIYCPNVLLKIAPRILDNPKSSYRTSFVMSGFWYLQTKQAKLARDFFVLVGELSHGQEMCSLADKLAIFSEVQDIYSLSNCTLPAIPPEPLLRPTSWEAIERFHRAVEDVRLVQRSPSRATRSFALNRALAEVTTILNQQDCLPETERGLIVQISETWQEILLQETAKIGDFSITEPVRNPYISGSPVIGKRFVGREDIMRKLEETWVMAEQLESVVLFGHRRMGKTSILRNVSTALGSRVKLAYVNLQGLGNDLAEILIEISYEISEVLEISSPNDDDFFKLPYPTFRRYLVKIEKQLDQNKLIIALDEFETIEHLINEGKIDPGFMQFLRTSIQQSPNIAFVLAGLHTLDEMTEDYFQPFFASVIPIQVGFMTKGSTSVILANPEDEDFSLDYQRETIDEIYNLTHGQPYLVNLIGFQLVSRYNAQVFEEGYSRDPQFTLADLNAVINGVLEQGRGYFTGVWKQATQGEPGQQEVLCALAPYPTGLDRETLSQTTNLDLKALDAALTCLEKHDVVIEQNGKFRIIVELFRRWVEIEKI
ncbi:ATP-binding protein [Roseofilum sp. BLCC_M154]|uniref:ATP-binding protein n=1 Tax=Roseofilum acuticapitatum BLCC-M154 TaxID=3022444 RepID=A0ABT7AQM8_9CYAN|nr:ATP-binding protein [Roseofilum acuticapitatum]MDJ1169215.1 ATP-binding protein [Roseofilum acuticapitatum BLCC-M154]